MTTLKEKGIEPIGGDTVVHSIHTESRNIIAFPLLKLALPIDENGDFHTAIEYFMKAVEKWESYSKTDTMYEFKIIEFF